MRFLLLAIAAAAMLTPALGAPMPEYPEDADQVLNPKIHVIKAPIPRSCPCKHGCFFEGDITHCRPAPANRRVTPNSGRPTFNDKFAPILNQ
ncbi:MAG: hypothetical protein M1829_005071 [Trizodia sp. TS-e1964]|nr:MAG: hypothetical protein M1829_005071 [Trizodia sp. TS-e1964]